MAQDISHHVFPNGLTLLAERMEHVRSAAVNFLVPAGCVYDPPDRAGSASVLAEWMTRGAGERDSRALTLALDNLGVDRSESAGVLHSRIWAATLAKNLPDTLEIYADILRRPHLPEDQLDAVKALALQEIQALEDEPSAKAMIELRRRHYPAPLGRDRRGTAEGIMSLTCAEAAAQFRELFQPSGVILAVAGNVEWQPLKDHVERIFGDWQAGEMPGFIQQPADGGWTHLQKDTTQTQIGLAYPSVPFGHEDYYAALGAVRVLSGGMSGRLFTEVREERGLCYSVSASYQSFPNLGAILCYAGTTAERAQETLAVTMAEMARLADGIEEDEVQRVQAGVKSALIMQEESTSARAGVLASDWFYLNRVRSAKEIEDAVQRLTPESIVDYVRRHPLTDPTVVTLGSEPLPDPRARPVGSCG